MGKSLSFIDPGLSAVTSGDPSNADPFDLLGTKAGRAAQESQKQQNQAERDLKIAFSNQAREDLFDLFPSAQSNRELGFQRALDIQGNVIPQQFSAMQQGNIGAQEALLAGLPQMRNAILGRPTHMDQLQPRSINVDTGFAQQQLPQFTTPLLGEDKKEADRLAQEEADRLEEEAEAAKKAQATADAAANLQNIMSGFRI